ncbi:MAG: lysylphosphatidylglycerol synthase transmembrane domain-containing protein [Rhodothermales bacterium]
MSNAAERTSETGTGNGLPKRPDEPQSPISLKRILWPLLLSLTVLVVIGIFTFEAEEYRQIVGRINGWWMGAALLSVVLRVYMGGWRLDFISHGRLGRSAAVRAQLAWDFFSNVTPSAIGGAPFAAIYVARDKRIDVGESTSLLLFTVLLDQIWFALTIPVVLVTSLYMDVIPTSFGDVGTAAFVIYFLGLLAWVVFFGYATLVRPDHLQRFAAWLFTFRWLRRFQNRVEREMRQLRHRAKILRSQPVGFYVKGLLLTIGTWMGRYLLLVFIVWGFLEEFDKVLMVLRTAAMTLGTLVLPTPGGAGGIEGLYALFIGPMIPAAILVPTLLVWRFLGYYLFIGLGVFLSAHHVQKTIRRNARDAADGARHDDARKDDARENEARAEDEQAQDARSQDEPSRPSSPQEAQ